ncbi:Protein serine/threonine phosphatase PrpC, regulation of stationary phase [Minicystis rosea]|nr:Protein serine/threonine phosphatase PrpC, regulation of stationary phase [Minicystis rosea]
MPDHISLSPTVATASVAKAATGAAFEVGVATITGRRRINADAYLIDQAAGFFAVADGMGDTPRSGVIARMALEAVRELFLSPWLDLPAAERWPGEAGERLRLGVVQANGRLYVKDREEAQRMGTTFAGAVVCSNYLCVACVGDSRVYLFRPRTGRLARLTQDDTVLAEALARGVPLEVVATRPDAHALTRAIGTERAIELWPLALRWRPGDVLLICTDGLTDRVDDGTIARTLGVGGDLAAAAQCLVRRSSTVGGEDNATVVLARRV